MIQSTTTLRPSLDVPTPPGLRVGGDVGASFAMLIDTGVGPVIAQALAAVMPATPAATAEVPGPTPGKVLPAALAAIGLPLVDAEYPTDDAALPAPPPPPAPLPVSTLPPLRIAAAKPRAPAAGVPDESAPDAADDDTAEAATDTPSPAPVVSGLSAPDELPALLVSVAASAPAPIPAQVSVSPGKLARASVSLTALAAGTTLPAERPSVHGEEPVPVGSNISATDRTTPAVAERDAPAAAVSHGEATQPAPAPVVQAPPPQLTAAGSPVAAPLPRRPGVGTPVVPAPAIAAPLATELQDSAPAGPAASTTAPQRSDAATPTLPAPHGPIGDVTPPPIAGGTAIPAIVPSAVTERPRTAPALRPLSTASGQVGSDRIAPPAGAASPVTTATTIAPPSAPTPQAWRTATIRPTRIATAAVPTSTPVLAPASVSTGALTIAPGGPVATPPVASAVTAPVVATSSLSVSPPAPIIEAPAPTMPAGAVAPAVVVAAAAPMALPSAPRVGPASRIFAAALHEAGRLDDARPADPLSLAPVVADPSIRVIAGTGAAQSAPLDLRQDRWPHAMIDRIDQLRDAANATDTRIRLVPDALGAIDVRLTRDGDAVHVHLAADQAATRTLLSEAQPRLAELAEARGLKLGQTSVDAGGSGQPGRQAPQPQTPQRPASATIVRGAEPAGDETETRIA